MQTSPSASPCAICRAPGVCRCIACGTAGCAETSHVYDLFMTHRYGTKGDEIGSKFGYLCTACEGLVCVGCMGLRSGYPCAEADVERHLFTCPRCDGPVSVLRFDNVGYWDAVAAMREALHTWARPEGVEPTLIPYTGYDPVSSLKPRAITAVAFGPRPVAMLPGDAWKTVLRYRGAGGVKIELALLRYDHPVVRTDLLVTTPSGPVYVGTLEPDAVYYDDRLLRQAGLPGEMGPHLYAGLPGEGGPVLSLSVPGAEVFVVNLGGAEPVELEKVGVLRGVRPPPRRSLSDIAEPPWRPADEEAERGVRKFDELLTALTDKHIWDYTWLEAPRPDGFKKGAILAMAGSTDLTYYHLVRVVFKGVLFNTTQVYFHHPDFRLAPPAVTRQLMDLVPFGPKSKAICVSRDFGGSFQETGFVVADYLFVMDEDMDTPYRPRKASNVDWWYT